MWRASSLPAPTWWWRTSSRPRESTARLRRAGEAQSRLIYSSTGSAVPLRQSDGARRGCRDGRPRLQTGRPATAARRHQRQDIWAAVSARSARSARCPRVSGAGMKCIGAVRNNGFLMASNAQFAMTGMHPAPSRRGQPVGLYDVSPEGRRTYFLAAVSVPVVTFSDALGSRLQADHRSTQKPGARRVPPSSQDAAGAPGGRPQRRRLADCSKLGAVRPDPQARRPLLRPHSTHLAPRRRSPPYGAKPGRREDARSRSPARPIASACA